MPDAQQAAYDAANRQIKQLEKQVEYYRRIATIWQEVAGRLIAILELAGDDHVCKG